jgi:hypothetical protein
MNFNASLYFFTSVAEAPANIFLFANDSQKFNDNTCHSCAASTAVSRTIPLTIHSEYTLAISKLVIPCLSVDIFHHACAYAALVACDFIMAPPLTNGFPSFVRNFNVFSCLAAFHSTVNILCHSTILSAMKYIVFLSCSTSDVLPIALDTHTIDFQNLDAISS